MQISYTHHLVGLIGEAEATAARLAGADPDRRQEAVAAARREQALLSARLDGSPIETGTAAIVDEREAAGLSPVDAAAVTDLVKAQGGWAGALKLDAMATQDVAAVEYANLLHAFDAEAELAARLFRSPADVLIDLQGHICQGLVEPGVIGRLRSTEVAIHDGRQGMVVYNAPPPESLPAKWERLTGWLGRGSAGMPALVVAGVVHERILEWQPFEAANGRLARAAARVVLRARGLDPHGLAVPERHYAADTHGYHAEVAATIRRRGDLTPWLERFVEATAAALTDAAAVVAPAPAGMAPAMAASVLSRLGEFITVPEYARAAQVSLDEAHGQLRALAVAGLVSPEPGAKGLRFRRR